MSITPTLRRPNRPLITLEQVERSASRYRVPIEDALLIAINLYGISSGQNLHRARLAVRLSRMPRVPWQVIVPLNAASSPFHLHDGELTVRGKLVAHVERIDADEAVGGYFRDGGRAATLNPNARSRCTGCAFCPNTLEAAADPRLAEDRALDELLAALVEQHPRRDLSGVREVTVSTGCFEREQAAVHHLVGLRAALRRHRIDDARIGFLTSVIRSRPAFDEVASTVAPFVLRLTAECFGRRGLLLKASKARLSRMEMPDVLERAQSAGLDASYTYIVGLDTFSDLRDGVTALQPHITDFPNFQVYQAHNSIMAGLRSVGAAELDYYLEARCAIEAIVGPSGLRPTAWECYRPLWYFAFAGEELLGARAEAA